MKKALLILLLLTATLSHRSVGQDPYFSQFYNSPLTINPALTGISFGNVRVGVHYRNHLSSIDPFQTYAFSFDMSLFEKNKNNNFGGVGLVVMNDESGVGLKNLKSMLSFAYHKSIGSNQNQYISLGAQAGIDQTNLGLSSLSTQNQWVSGNGYNPDLPQGGDYADENIINLDFQAGVLWYAFLSKKSTVFAGGSVFHITEPNQSLTNGDSKLSRRYVLHTGGKFGVSKRVSIVPNFVFMQQNSFNVINTGVFAEYDLSTKYENKIFSIGGWVRNLDAVIVTTGFEFKNVSIGLSYDMILSELKDYARNGGFEISLVYTFRKNISNNAKLRSNPSPKL